MKTNKLEDLGVLINNSTEYKGRLAKYQQEGRVRYQKHLKLNSTQQKLYQRALSGLSAYSEQEVKKMHWEKKRRIKRINEKAQTSINILKQLKVNALCHNALASVFPRSELVQNLFSFDETSVDPEFINTLELKSLGITKKEIINRFIDEGILPKNFYQLKKAG